MSRGILRKILSIYIGMTPGEVPLSADRWGKPLLTSRDGAPPVHFNMSHSVDVLLVAVARGSQVGVDVEWIDPALDWAPIADFVLSRSDVRAIRNVPEVHRRAAFYSLWTQWEALSKAIGCGLSLPRTSAVSVGRLGNWAGHQHDNWEGPEGGQWRTRILTPRCGYVAALAVGPSSDANMKFHYVARPPWEALVKPIGEERSPTPPAGDPDER
jgi:4'-phosphopantetheinyl transferase